MFNTIVIQAVLACVMAMVVVLITGPYLIPYLTRLKVGQVIRDDGPQRHLTKAGTPTMGGLMFIAGISVASIVTVGNKSYVWAALAVMLLHAAIGLRDDYIKVVLKRSLGLRVKEKLLYQLLIGLLFIVFLIFLSDRGTSVIIPFSGYALDIGYAYYLLVIAVIIGTSNGVNLNDGLDGLASGVTIWVALAYMAISWMGSHPELGVFSLAIVGGCLGFLYYNRFPARVFMGDTGSMALGGAVAALAILTRSELFLILIGGVYVLEAMSDIIQVAYFKRTGKRVFLMAPIHHHYELKGWKETKVVHFFWLLSFICSISGVLLYYFSV